jgi:hypothetical protein
MLVFDAGFKVRELQACKKTEALLADWRLERLLLIAGEIPTSHLLSPIEVPGA